MSGRRSAGELRHVPEPAWPQIESLTQTSPGPVRILVAEAARRDTALEALQVSTASFLGALAGECGGLLVDNGWVRILGAGALGLPGLHEANVIAEEPPPLLDVAWDVLGGRFAINGGGLDAPPGEVCYWGPDTLDWTPIGGGHSAFITWALSGGPAEFYASLRWASWEQEVSTLSPSQGLSLMPPPFTIEGQDLAKVSRAPVPMSELRAFYDDVAQQLGDQADGSQFTVRTSD